MSQNDDSRKAQKNAQQQASDDVKSVMATAYGRRFVNRLIQSCGVNQGGYIGSSEVYYRAGVRDVGIRLQDEVRALCPEMFIQMLQEAQAK